MIYGDDEAGTDGSISFVYWLKCQVGARDAIGRLARRVQLDGLWPYTNQLTRHQSYADAIDRSGRTKRVVTEAWHRWAELSPKQARTAQGQEGADA